MHPIQPTELRQLILAVLSCLPTAFFSPNAPPALLALLSPILRQRVHLLASSTSSTSESTSNGTWLKLLTWSSERAERLVDIVSRLQLEPHPVSGEMELFGDSTDPDVGKVWYRRLDEETIQARCDAQEYGLGFVWVWSTNDSGGVGLEGTTNGDTQDAWKMAEVIPLEGDENLELEGWLEDLTEAEHSGRRAMQDATNRVTRARASGHFLASASNNADSDDDYWASYDRTPGKATPAPSRGPNAFQGQNNHEQDYFARYSAIQPAMDAHDPDEETDPQNLGVGQRGVSSLPTGQPHDRDDSTNDEVDIFRNLNAAIEQQAASPEIAMPTTQRHSALAAQRDVVGDPLVALPERSSSESSTAAETSVKQHISYEIKSLFRLAQGVGMEREEFDEIVRRELEVLGQIEL